jgi:hypothetical protein
MVFLYYRSAPHWRIYKEAERAVGPDGKLLVTDNCFHNALLNVPMMPNPNMHGRRMHSILAEDEGLDAAGIVDRWRGYGVTHVLTSEAFDHSAAERELRERWLEPLSTEGVKTLYRIRSVRDGLTGHGS